MADPYSTKPWLKFYDKHVPPNLEYPQKTYLAYFREAVASVPHKELEFQLSDSAAKCLITLDIFYEKVAAVWEKTGVKTVVVSQIADFLPPVSSKCRRSSLNC